jgi:O-antigen/teichoic acid export membrane protein
MTKTVSIRSLLNKGQYSFYIALAEKGVFFIIFMYFARTLNVAEYGMVMISFTVANILSSFFEFGFAPYFQREAATHSNSIEEELNSVLGFKVVAFFLYGLLTVLYFTYIGTDTPLSVALVATTIYVFGISGIFSRTLFGFNQYVDSFKSLIVSKIIIFIVVGIFIIFKASFEFLLLALLGGAILQTISLMSNVSHNGIIFKLALKAKILKRVIKSSLPIGIGLSFVWIYDKADVILIQRIIGNEAVSFYAVAYSLYKIPQVIAGVILLPFFTEISNRYATEGSLSMNELFKPALLLVTVSGVIILAYNCIPEIFLSLAYGNLYKRSGWILSILSFALPGLLLNNLTGNTLNALRKERKVMNSTFFAFLLNIGLNVILLPRLGIVGAVIATICTEYFMLCIQIYYIQISPDIKRQKNTL